MRTATPGLCVVAVGSNANLVKDPVCSTLVPTYCTPDKRTFLKAEFECQREQLKVASHAVAADGFEFFKKRLEAIPTAATPTERQNDLATK